ncbi:MAG TPA: hypothetical protein VI685_28350 [Candidatus Angelobacter sp.]
MKGLVLLVVFFASVPLLAAQDAPPDTQAGNFLYKMPNGWTPEEKGDTTILHAPSPPRGTATFIAMAADNMEGDLQNSFNVLWSGFKNSYRILQGGQISPLHGNGYDAFTTNAVATDQNGVRWTVYVMGAQYKQRIQTVMFMSSVPPGTMLNAYQQVFTRFVSNLRFGDALPGSQVPPANAAPVEEAPHKLPPGALEGIYVGFGLGAGGRMGTKTLLFSADGWVVKNVPEEGMIGFDFTANRNNPDTNRSWVGRYRVQGNQISILWQDYADDRQVVTRNENSFSPGIDVYIPMCRCTGKRFSGKYNFGLAGSDQYMQFFPDGTFVDHKVLDQMLVPSAFYDHPRIQRGSYSIQNQTMIFTFADGRRGMRTFYAPKAQEKGAVFDWICLGGHDLYEEHHVSEP